ncbi:MAG: hypothetical protein D6698_13345, partial [Gammaproteobacteria bacterium]
QGVVSIVSYRFSEVPFTEDQEDLIIAELERSTTNFAEIARWIDLPDHTLTYQEKGEFQSLTGSLGGKLIMVISFEDYHTQEFLETVLEAFAEVEN